MKIITLGESPYLLTKDGKIHGELLRSLKKDGYYPEGIVANHDVQYFLPDEVGEHFYEHGDGNRTRLYPFSGLGASLPQIVTQTLQRSQANAIITIGDYGDTSFIAYIKAHNPKFFKWIMLLTSGSTLVNERHRERILQADYIITTTAVLCDAVKALGAINVEHIPFGPCPQTFFPTNERKQEFKALCVCKCLQNSNLGTFIKGIALSDTKGTLHTNRDDRSDYDLPLLVERHKVTEQLELTKGFNSIRDGLSEKELNSLYNTHHAIVDCSLQSGTALTLLEGMSTGCVPIGVEFGAVGEVLSKMPDWCRFSVGYETFIGPGQEEHAIAKTKELAEALSKIKHMSAVAPEDFARASSKAREVAGFFVKDRFLDRLNDILANVLQGEHAIVVDSY